MLKVWVVDESDGRVVPLWAAAVPLGRQTSIPAVTSITLKAAQLSLGTYFTVKQLAVQ